jgi:hypothetical protein
MMMMLLSIYILNILILNYLVFHQDSGIRLVLNRKGGQIKLRKDKLVLVCRIVDI